jgi:secondary thiamine-phosphate synthase enzyme
MRTFALSTSSRECLIDVTREVARAVTESGVREGLCTVFVPHTTAAVTINENADPDVACDIVAFCAENVPQTRRFRHAEGNSDAHIKASFFGSSVQVPVDGGKLALGTWQGIYFAEFDGPRSRKYHVVVQGA